MFDKLDAALKALARGSAYAGALALLGCVAVTVVDVVKRNFLQSSVFGSVELVQLGVLWGAFLTIPLGFAFGSHISVDVFVGALKDGARRVIGALNMLASALVMLACLWWGGASALHAIATHEVTLTAGVPMWLYWLPLVFGTALSALAALSTALQVALNGPVPRHGEV